MAAQKATPAEQAPADLSKGLSRAPKHLPCRFLYDDVGSQLYEQITALEEYYPYRAELSILQHHADAIAAQLPPGGVVVELGCGSSSKTAVLLAAAVRRHGAAAVRFCGVDCSAEALRQTRRSLQKLVPELPQEQVELVEAEYLAGVEAVRGRHPAALLSVLWLGSSVGNFSAAEAPEFLQALRRRAGPRSQLLLGADLWKDAGVLRAAYQDHKGVSQAFILNGVHHALSTLGHADAHRPDLWQYEVEVNPELQQVEMYAKARRRVPGLLPGVHVEAGERVLVEVSRKFTQQSVAGMAYEAGLCSGGCWSSSQYGLHLLLTPEVALERCWADTDGLFSQVLDWQAQPIGLRHPFCFYYGHVAAFAKLRLLPQEPASELDGVLSRGVDPSVLDPDQCHSHPAVPPAWPSQRQLERYVGELRRRLTAAMQQGVRCGRTLDGAEGEDGAGGAVPMHALCMVLEHERMHQETLCYMLAQQRKADASGERPAVLRAAPHNAAAKPGANRVDGSLCADSTDGEQPHLGNGAAPPPFYFEQCNYLSTKLSAGSPKGTVSGCASNGSSTPETGNRLEPATPERAPKRRDGRLPNRPEGPATPAACKVEALPVWEGFVSIPAGKVTLGVDPAAPHGFLWDCEMGRLGPLPVPAMAVAAAPVTVAEFRRFVFEEGGYERPELWDGEAYRHLRDSGHTMPATWSQLADAHAVHSRPGSVPHQEGHRLWVHMPEGSYSWEEVADCPAYVSLAEAQAYCRLHSGRLLTQAEWQHVAASAAAASGAVQQLEAGGWEWTSSALRPLPGFQADPLYPEFSADFFASGEHFVLRGAGPYTHPSIARFSFRNWYQRLYPAVLAKFRLVLCATQQDG